MPSSHNVRRGVAVAVATLGLALGPPSVVSSTMGSADAALPKCSNSQGGLYLVCGSHTSKAACEAARKSYPVYRTRSGQWRLSCIQLRGAQSPWSLASPLM